MLQVARWRVILVIVVTLLGIVLALPNFLPENVRNSLPPFVPRQTINLGLDLRGGSQLLLEVDVNALQRAKLDDIAGQMATVLRDAEPQILSTGRGVVGDAARIRLVNPSDMERAMRVVDDLAVSPAGGAATIRFIQGADGLIEARMTDAYKSQLSRDAAQQSIEVIRRRIDPQGTSEISISRQGDSRIAVQAPGVSDPEVLRSRIGQTAVMTFHLVPSTERPTGTMTAGPYPGMEEQGNVTVQRRPEFTGERLQRAYPTTDSQTGEWVLAFQLDNRGTTLFCRITQRHTGERFAILLDNMVLTAPRINEPICGGTGQISGNFSAQSANELAIMLNAGALPAPLNVVEQRSVTAELGQDAIESGQTSTMLAFVLVLIFMVLAYGLLFGGISVLALVVNGILIMAAMTLFGAALTLPGVAGLILTLAVALDANVLIYERMREEVKAGRGAALAIDAGFSRAMLTILDANTTHLGAALLMLAFAPPGPVKGFAWTLTIGVFTSVFTAVLITQIMIAWWFRAARPKKLPIA
ncbi:MAG: protein translocase subunit SecD [Vitreimonas sp.]